MITALIFITQPAGIIIGQLTKSFRNELGASDGLDKAGQYIGITERLLVFIFALMGQFSAIGFLIAAKSVLRIAKDGETEGRKKTEYVLIGTLISFTLAILTALLVKKLI